MIKRNAKRGRHGEAGTALLIALFALLLIGVVAIALIVASGTESALSGNYRSATIAYYDALAGLEEARGRLNPKSPDFFNVSSPGFFPVGTPVDLTHVYYIVNPDSTSVDPVNGPFQDTEYSKEFAPAVLAAQTVATINSNSAIAGLPGASYKWVRINAATEQSLNLDVTAGGVFNNTHPLYFDPAHLDSNGNIKPSLISTGTPPATAVEVFEITALAVLPNGTQRMLQYVVAPGILTFVAPGSATNFPAALTLDGNRVQFSAPNTSGFVIDGTDHAPADLACAAGAASTSGVGYANNTITVPGDTSQGNIVSQIGVPYIGKYKGVGAASPNVNYVTSSPPGPSAPAPGISPLAANLSSVGGLNDLIKQIKGGADVYIGHSADTSDPLWPSSASWTAANPKTIVVDGDFWTNTWHHTGYGTLLVTGQFTWDPDTYWEGMILVVGQGVFESYQGGVGTIQGGVLVARLFDSSNNPLIPNTATPDSPFFLKLPPPPTPTPLSPSPSLTVPPTAGNGIYYSSCWIKAAMPTLPYQVLSFKEIAQ